MLSPFGGNLNTDWALLAGGADEDQFSRLELNTLDIAGRVFAGPEGREPKSFDWVDEDTIIYTSYETRGNIYLADVTADPFTVTTNTAWNAQGSVATAAERIRNVRVGDFYNTHAYYAEAQTADETDCAPSPRPP